MLRILFCGGGSLGHLAPSVAVWEALREKLPRSKAFFVSSASSEDRRFLKELRLDSLPIHAPKAQLGIRMLFFPMLFPLACLEAFCILLFFRPHVIFSKGGYVSVPVCLMGRLLFRPVVLHESDRIMGRANRFLLRLACHLCIGSPQKEILNGDLATKIGLPVTATGNPIRKDILKGSVDGGRRVTGFSGKRPVLLIIGGSQGSQALNAAVQEHLEELLTVCDIAHITGRGKLGPKTHARYLQREVFYEELQNLYALADVVISRAGAGAIAELSAAGKATVLVPIPDLANHHQEENARFLELAGAVIVLSQEKLHEELVPRVNSLLADSDQRRILGERFQTFAVPDAAEHIANILREICGEK